MISERTRTALSSRGGRRECISPFFDDPVVTGPTGASDKEAIYIEASAGGSSVGYMDENEALKGLLSSQHVEYCYSRYRSYRPEDNTYQPYGGGSRRQCQ